MCCCAAATAAFSVLLGDAFAGPVILEMLKALADLGRNLPVHLKTPEHRTKQHHRPNDVNTLSNIEHGTYDTLIKTLILRLEQGTTHFVVNF